MSAPVTLPQDEDEHLYSFEPARARRHLASLPRERREQLFREWNTPANGEGRSTP